LHFTTAKCSDRKAGVVQISKRLIAPP
jgi:hypothetical protein